MSEGINENTLLEVEDLKVYFKLKRSSMFAAPAIVHAVDGISFKIERGQTYTGFLARAISMCIISTHHLIHKRKK